MGANRVIIPGVLFLTALTLAGIGLATPADGPARFPLLIAAGVDAAIGLYFLLFGVPGKFR